MKKTVLLFAMCLFVGETVAQPAVEEQGYVFQEQEFQPLEPTYLENVFVNNPWDSNWFISVKGGMSAFLGKPTGCGDFFDRTEPLLNVSLGKWFTPYFGGRLGYQGLKLKDSWLERRPFQNIHTDFLYNIASHFRRDYETLPKWDFIAYAGCGIIRNSFTSNKPFAMSFGVIGRYRIADRLHLSGELGTTMTWQDFDGYGPSNKLGDNLLQASIGLDLTIGKVGWKRVIDSKPYIFQNDLLIDHLERMNEENARLNKVHLKDALALKEMRKILEIEGLLDKYELLSDEAEAVKNHPRNNYSGLNSLRERLRNKTWNGDPDSFQPMVKTDYMQEADSTSMSPEEYFRIMKDGKIFVGAPVFFFFKLGTSELTEKAQIINIKEVAGAIKKYGLNARIVGAADSQTGTAYGNERLSAKRADYIAAMLRENGVADSKIQTQYRGGISSYEPQTGNRNTCVMLYFK